MVRLFKLLLVKRHFPKPWKTSKAVLIPKSDGVRVRMIHIQQTLAKMLELMILEEINQKLPKSWLQQQFAYRDGIGVNNLILSMFKDQEEAIEGIAKISAKRRSWLLYQTDVQCAFDDISRSAVVSTISKLCSNELGKMIKSFLSDRRTCIIDGDTRLYQESTKGTPQGSILGPCSYVITMQEAIRSTWRLEPYAKAPMVYTYADDVHFAISSNRFIHKREGSKFKSYKLNEAKEKGDKILEELNKNLEKLNLSISIPKTNIYSKYKGDCGINQQHPKILGVKVYVGSLPRTNKVILKDKIDTMKKTSSVLLNKIQILKSLTYKKVKMITNALIESHLTSLSPLLIEQIIKSNRTRMELEAPTMIVLKKAKGIPIHAQNDAVNQIYKRKPLWAKIIKIGLNWLKKREGNPEASFTLNKLIEMYPILEAINEGKDKLDEMIDALIRNDYKFHTLFPSQESIPTEHSNDWIFEYPTSVKFPDCYTQKLGFLLGFYDYTYENHECICDGKSRINVKHWIIDCPLTEDIRNNFITNSGMTIDDMRNNPLDILYYEQLTGFLKEAFKSITKYYPTDYKIRIT